jgi:hypothetical protein
MSYASDVIFYVPFDSDPILEVKSSTFFTSYGVEPIMVPAKFKTGWQMSDTTYIGINNSITLSSAMTIGFWLNSVNPGVVTNPTSKATVPLLMPLMSKASFTGTTNINSSTWTFIMWEETQIDGTNIMKVALQGLVNTTSVYCTLYSSPYDVGVYHHFWIVYSGGSVPSLRLFVDTVEDYSSTIYGTIPAQLSMNSATFSINNSVLGPSYQIARNQGIIDDLAIFSSVKDDTATIKEAANNGIAYIAVSEQVGTVEVDQAAVFDDPGTAQINAVYPSRGRLYIARSDGQLRRGDKLLWQSRKDFSQNAEIEYVTSIVKKATDGTATISDNSLSITDAVVRL